MKKLILFDFDGVLFDSEKNMKISWESVMKKFSIKKTFKHYKKFIGIPFRQILLNLNIKFHHKEIENHFQNNSIKHINKIKPFPGVIETLKKNKNRNFIWYLDIETQKKVDKVLKKYNLKFDLLLTPQKKLEENLPRSD